MSEGEIILKRSPHPVTSWTLADNDFDTNNKDTWQALYLISVF